MGTENSGRYPKLTAEERKRIIGLVADGMRPVEVAREVARSAGFVQRIVREDGGVAEIPERLAAWVLLVTVVLPAFGGIGARAASSFLAARGLGDITGWRRRLAVMWPASAPPSVWDWLFTERVPDGNFLLIEFTDGTRVAGVFDADSIALTSPEPHGVFLSSEWLVDANGDISAPVPDSEGIMIGDMTAVRSVRVLRGGEP